MSKCPAWPGLCENDMLCHECVNFPCDRSWRYEKTGRPPYKSTCFRCKHVKAVPMGVKCELKGGE